MIRYTIARLVNPELEEWLSRIAPRMWTDEPEEALMYESLDQLPETEDGQYPVKMIFDERGEWVERIERGLECAHSNKFTYNHGYHTVCTECGKEV